MDDFAPTTTTLPRRDKHTPCIMDLEASGFGDQSYPIEVAWCDDTGTINRLLIKPTVPAWTWWSDEAEAVHGIDRDRLQRNGWDPEFVIAEINRDLAGRTVYTDAPDFDGAWLTKLYDAFDAPIPFVFEHIDELLLPLVQHDGEMMYQAVNRLAAIKDEVMANMAGKHSAGYDVGFLLQLWRRANGLETKMNHGVGPLPTTTFTGSFKVLKQRGSHQADGHGNAGDEG